jgi:TRAP-type mannitol/chloroaromatic compound transport system substrate-binding protein
VIAVLAVELDVNGTKLLCHACSYYYVVKHKVRVSVA